MAIGGWKTIERTHPLGGGTYVGYRSKCKSYVQLRSGGKTLLLSFDEVTELMEFVTKIKEEMSEETMGNESSEGSY